MKKPTLYLMSGVPGSGKSTWAREFAQKSGAAYVSRDEIRFSLLQPEDDYFAHESEVLNIFYKTIKDALSSGKDCIADATHLNRTARDICLSNIPIDKNVILVKMNTDLKTCLERNAARTGRAHVPDKTIIDMYKSFCRPDSTEYNEVWVIT